MANTEYVITYIETDGMHGLGDARHVSTSERMTGGGAMTLLSEQLWDSYRSWRRWGNGEAGQRAEQAAELVDGRREWWRGGPASFDLFLGVVYVLPVEQDCPDGELWRRYEDRRAAGRLAEERAEVIGELVTILRSAEADGVTGVVVGASSHEAAAEWLYERVLATETADYGEPLARSYVRDEAERALRARIQALRARVNAGG